MFRKVTGVVFKLQILNKIILKIYKISVLINCKKVLAKMTTRHMFHFVKKMRKKKGWCFFFFQYIFLFKNLIFSLINELSE